MNKAPKKRWLFSKEYHPGFLDWKPLRLLDEHARWRKVAEILKISREGKKRLEWIIYTKEGHSVVETVRHFGITRKSYYKWSSFFDPDNLYSLKKLEDRSRAPLRVRTLQLSSQEIRRIVALRKHYPFYGKRKLAVRYKDIHGTFMSSWHIQKIIEQKELYQKPAKTKRTTAKRKRSMSQGTKKKTIELISKLSAKKKKAGFIICLDTVMAVRNGLRRYIFTAVDKYGKVAFARMYTSKSTINSADFLQRLRYLLDGKVPRVGHDNGSEFGKRFKRTCQEFGIEQYYSRVRTPKDNPENERFNRTLRTEFLSQGNMHSDIRISNRKMTDWLIEYNFERPHESLGYHPPLTQPKVSPMYSSCTPH
jgi:transposase InsO family protein